MAKNIAATGSSAAGKRPLQRARTDQRATETTRARDLTDLISRKALVAGSR